MDDVKTLLQPLLQKDLNDASAIRVIRENPWPRMRVTTAIAVYTAVKHEFAKGKPDPFALLIRKVADFLQISPGSAHAYLHRLSQIGLITLERNVTVSRGMRCSLVPQYRFGGLEELHETESSAH